MAVADILLTGAQMYYAPVGEGFPDETTVAYGASWGGNWTDIGKLARPVTLVYNEQRADSEQQDTITTVKDFRVRESHFLRSALRDFTGDGLALLLHGSNTDTSAGASQKPYSRILGGGDPIVDQYVVGFEGYRADSAGTQQPVRIFYYKASFMLQDGFSFSKEDTTIVPFGVKTYADDSKAIGQQMFEWHIVTGPTS